jgi:hypothetical protein
LAPAPIAMSTDFGNQNRKNKNLPPNGRFFVTLITYY